MFTEGLYTTVPIYNLKILLNDVGSSWEYSSKKVLGHAGMYITG